MARSGPLKTLRATPQKAFGKIYRTYDFIQYQVQFFGQTAALKRSKGNIVYWDIEFTTRKGALSTLRSCKVENLDFVWAPRNIKGQKPKGRAVVSFLPPRFDQEESSEEPSLPAPCNNPYPNMWIRKKKNPEEAEIWYPSRVQPNAVSPFPPRVQRKAVSPFPPFNAPRWPNYPTYSREKN